MTGAITTLARYALVEARRGALPWLAGAGALGSVALSWFFARVAIVESAALQAAACAAFVRAWAVFLVASHVVASTVRESNDKGVELALALPLSRATWYLGKLCGHAIVAVAVATVAALPVFALAPGPAAAGWWLGLCAECALVASMALFFAAALGQTVPAIACCAGLYLLGRTVGAMQAIAAGPLAGDDGAGPLARWLLEAFALLLPRLDAIAVGDWLLYGTPPAAEFLRAVGGVAVYFALLAAAGLFDASRRNL